MNTNLEMNNTLEINSINNVINKNYIFSNFQNETNNYGGWDGVIYVNEKQYDRILKRRMNKIKQEMEKNKKISAYINIQKKVTFPNNTIITNNRNGGPIENINKANQISNINHANTTKIVNTNGHNNMNRFVNNTEHYNNGSNALYPFDGNQDDSKYNSTQYNKNNSNNNYAQMYENIKYGSYMKNSKNIEKKNNGHTNMNSGNGYNDTDNGYLNNYNGMYNSNGNSSDDYKKYMNVYDINTGNNVNNIELNNGTIVNNYNETYHEINNVNKYNNVSNMATLNNIENTNKLDKLIIMTNNQNIIHTDNINHFNNFSVPMNRNYPYASYDE
ncbi:hypothetical protein YYG_01808 [Plasmodium vinckei petteri]|uniref:Uncharacterized protein n=1 Tax=Plasmodium vinckei petteri TaxID=138298 RepID=W7AND4_PLAVN|nr:hypothetical protein YYG_01808 [Plasmodium vinckei petteri]CAD2104043.1 conserved Plasmodium protein, unknown function [Plasmodium vinckei petteri]